MTYLTDQEWDRLVDLTMLEVECHVLAADAKAMADAADDMETRLLILQLPDSRLARLYAEARQFIQSAPHVPGGHDDVGYMRHCVDVACYGWRRDYDEWPTFANLVDRLAVDGGMTHRAAARRIIASLNDQGRGHTHMIRTARLAEILADEETTLGPWQHGELADVRLYVAAEGITSTVQAQYRDRCWRAEAS